VRKNLVHSVSRLSAKSSRSPGNVTSTGELHLNGQVQGDVRCVALVLAVQGDAVSGALSGDARTSLIGLQRLMTNRPLIFCKDFGRHGREPGIEAYPLHGHQTDNVSVITLASVADLSCAFSSSNTIKSNSASVIPSGRQMLTPLAI
jgi:hypothetical protein